MNQELASYESSSGNQIYKIIKGADGVTYCTCKGWAFNKNCKHLLDWTAGGGRRAMQVREVLDESVSLILDGDESMEGAIQRAIHSLKSL